MARFAGSSPPRRSALLGTPAPQKIWRWVNAFCTSYDVPSPKNLYYDGGGSGPVTAYATTGVSYTKGVSLVTQGGNKYVARVDIPAPAGVFVSSNWELLYLDYAESGTSYTAWSSIVVYEGEQYLAEENITAPAGPFDATKWQKLFVFAKSHATWLAPALTASGNPNHVFDVLTQHPYHAAGVYSYLSDVDTAVAGNDFGQPSRQWLDDNNGWATADGSGSRFNSVTITGNITTGSATVTALSSTAGLVVGMLVSHPNIDHAGLSATDFSRNQVFIKSINSGASTMVLGYFANDITQTDFSLLTDYGTPNTTGVNATATGVTIVCDNLVVGKAIRSSAITNRHVNIVDPAVDSEGLTYAQWYARCIGDTGSLLEGLVGNVTRHCLDDTNPQESWLIADGDYVNYTFQTRNIYGTCKWDGTNVEPSNVDPNKTAHYQFKRDHYRALRKYNPGTRVWINGCVQGGLPDLWKKEVDYTLMEGALGATYTFDTGVDGISSGINGWKQVVKQANINNQDFCQMRRGNTINTHRYETNTGSYVTSQPIHKDMLFGLCTALLTESEWCFSDQATGATSLALTRYYLPEFEIELGTGVGAVADPDAPWLTLSGAQTAQVWRREFQAGWVFVNPRYLAGSGNWDDTPYYASFTLPFDVRRPAGCLDPNSDASLGGADGELITAGTTITMHSRSGLILLKV